MIIKNKPCYSQEIVIRLRNYGFNDLSEGTIFPMLLRLEKEDIFEIEKIAVSSGPKRKYYRLNGKGVFELNKFQAVWKDFRTIVDTVMEGASENNE